MVPLGSRQIIDNFALCCTDKTSFFCMLWECTYLLKYENVKIFILPAVYSFCLCEPECASVERKEMRGRAHLR